MKKKITIGLLTTIMSLSFGVNAFASSEFSKLVDEVEGFGSALVYAKETLLEGEEFKNTVIISKDFTDNYTVEIDDKSIQLAQEFWEKVLAERFPEDFSQVAKKEDLAMIINDIIRGNDMTNIVHGYTDTLELGNKYRWKFDFASLHNILPVDENNAVGVGEDITASYLREVLNNFVKYLFADYDNFMTNEINLAISENIQNPYLAAAYVEGLIPDYVMSLADELTLNSYGVSVALTNLCIAINHPFVVS